ncbi:sigma-54-dependent transcriptional regulator [Faunimonas sp. B44]|uniref:sigma-54-dependent transcriptional regulator n=1 Tax=Faunimonas sp. B44 TaxID=3461493 RepID=UPI004043C720
MPSRILVLDDDPAECRLIEETARMLGSRVETASSGEAALARVRRPDAPAVSVVVLSPSALEPDGFGILPRLGASPANPAVIVRADQPGGESALAAMRAGAFDVLVKPSSPARVRTSLANALRLAALTDELARTRCTRTGTLTLCDLICRAPAMERIVDLGERAARSSIPVLIEGEAGVGKETLARAIQGSSNRRSRPFVRVSCGGVSEALLESMLFDGETSAPAGMPERRLGKFREAQGGTLFLEEVADLGTEGQARLLRLLQDGEIDGPGPLKVDVRLIAATSRRLLDLVSHGAFREDLFYRLNILPIRLPPLRERREDIPALAEDFLARFAAEEGKRGIAGFADETMDALVAYDWPGNIRQLQNAVFRAVLLSEGGMLRPDDFPQVAEHQGSSAHDEVAPRPPAFSSASSASVAERRQHGPHSHRGLRPALVQADAGPAQRYGLARLLDERGEIRRFDALEEEVIRFALGHYRGRMSEVARRLGIGRSTLYRKLKDYGIDTEASVAPDGRTAPELAVVEQ